MGPKPPGYHDFQSAKAIHERFTSDIALALTGPTPEQVRQACADPGLARAESLYHASLHDCEQAGQPFNASIVHHQLGLLHLLRGQPHEAVPRFEQALAGYKQLAGFDQPTIAESFRVTTFYLGQALLESGRFTEARTQLELARTLDQDAHDRRRLDAIRVLLERCNIDDSSSPDPRASEPVTPTPTPTLSQPSPPPPQHGTVPADAWVWMIGWSEAAVHRLETTVRPAIADLLRSDNDDRDRPRDRMVATALAGAANPDIDPLRRDQTLCAVVLAIEPAGLADERYRAAFAACLAQVAARDDFRLFVTLEGITDAELSRRADEEKPDGLLRSLQDTVQLIPRANAAAAAADDEWIANLRTYLTHLQDVRRLAAWDRLAGSASRLLGYFALVIECVCFVIALAAALWLPVWDVHATMRQFAGMEPLLALICGIAGVPLLMIGLFAYTRYRPFLLRMHEDPRGILWSGLFSILGAPIILSPGRVKAPLASIVLGLVAGAILDTARRCGYRAARRRQQVDIATIAQRHGRLPLPLRREAAASAWLDPLRCPFLPRKVPDVFISYTRASEWGQRVARELAQHLGQFHIQLFLDQRDIPPGAGWRRFLNLHLARATVFIALADEQSVERTWPAAELEAALAGKHLTALPQIILITAPELARQTAHDAANNTRWRWLPAFRAVLEDPDRELIEARPRVMPYTSILPQALAWELCAHSYQSVSVCPPRLARSIANFRHILLHLLALLSIPSTLAGNAAILLAGIELLAKPAPLNAGLMRCTTHPAVTLLLAFWLGCVARQALASRFHLRIERSPNVYRVNLQAIIGFVAVLAIAWSARGSTPIPWLLSGWSIVSTIIGWWTTDEFCAREAARDPSFLRPAR